MSADSAIVNGALSPSGTTEPRHAIDDDVTMTVEPDGHTALFRRAGIKFPSGRRVAVLIGEIDGVRVAVARRDGRLHVLMTRGDIQL